MTGMWAFRRNRFTAMDREEVLAQMRRSSSHRTICEVHRELYDLTKQMEPETRTKVQDLIIEAFVMGKKMDAKLREYRADWDQGFYQPNTDHRADSKRRKS